MCQTRRQGPLHTWPPSRVALGRTGIPFFRTLASALNVLWCPVPFSNLSSRDAAQGKLLRSPPENVPTATTCPSPCVKPWRSRLPSFIHESTRVIWNGTLHGETWSQRCPPPPTPCAQGCSRCRGEPPGPQKQASSPGAQLWVTHPARRTAFEKHHIPLPASQAIMADSVLNEERFLSKAFTLHNFQSSHLSSSHLSIRNLN